jgi:hypothetical protein
VIGGSCQSKGLRYRLSGLDANGAIRVTFWREGDETERCTFTTTGPSTCTLGTTPEPTLFEGAYQCPTRSGTFALGRVPREPR